MATSAKKKAAQKQRALKENGDTARSETIKECNCLVRLRGRGQHAIGCPLFDEG